MSNHKMQFPSHISKSWLSVCIFIFLLTVCVGLWRSIQTNRYERCP